MVDADKIPSDEVITQLWIVRDTAAVNMYRVKGVRDVADQCEFDELVAWLDEIRHSPNRIYGDAYTAALDVMAYSRGREGGPVAGWIELDVGGHIWIPNRQQKHIYYEGDSE